jgi:rod shape-determining protein MreC
MKSLFKRSPTLHLRFVLMATLAVGLMVADRHTEYLQPARSIFSLVSAPLQYLVNTPVKFIAWFESTVLSPQRLGEENAHLKAEILILKGQIQAFTAMEKENRQLHALLQSNAPRNEKVAVAKLLGVANDPISQRITLSLGSKQRAFVGQPVLDANGVMGQVIQVGPLTSQVLLITDSESAVAVQNVRTGSRAIAVGGGAEGVLYLADVPKTVDIRAGDQWVTSGLGKRFPAGYPVGVVHSVQQPSGSSFLRVVLEPSAALYQTQLVLLLWPK